MKNLAFAIRYLTKARGNNFTRWLSLTLGLGVGLLVFSYVDFVATFDRFYPDSDRIYQLWTSYDIEGMKDNSSYMHAPMAPAMQEEMPQVEAATRLKGTFDYDFYYREHAFDLHFITADTMFFDVLDFGVLAGDPKQILADRDQMMLSESTARRIFGAEDPIGKTLMWKNEFPMTVGGIFRDPPVNTSLGRFDSLCSFEMIKDSFNTGWDNGDSWPTYFKLVEGARPEEVEVQFDAFLERHGITQENLAQYGQKYFVRSIDESNLTEGSLAKIVFILLALGFLTLFVAAMNYILVSISTLVSRSRTIAMLRIGGARRSDIFRIFLSETAMIIVVALAVDAFVLWALQGEILALTQYSVADLFALKRIHAPLAVILVVFIMAGVVPAMIFTSVPLSAAFKGAVDTRRRWKQALLFVQIVCITFVLSFLTVVTLQFDKTVNGDLGYEHDRVVSVMLLGNATMFDNIETELSSMPCVEAAGSSYGMPCYGASGQPCYDELTREVLFSARTVACSGNYFITLQIPVLAGRLFDATSSPKDAIVNEDYVRRRGWTPEEAVGRRIADNTEDGNAELMTVVGVVADYCMSQNSEIMPTVFHPLQQVMTNPNAYYGGPNTFVRLTEMTAGNIAAVEAKVKEWRSIDNHRVNIYDDTFHKLTQSQRSFRNVTAVVTLMIMAIAVIGLVGYVGDEIGRRRKEIAIRKVNGATSGAIMRMMMGSMALLALPGVAIGVAAACYVSVEWLKTYDNRITLSWWIFAFGAAVVMAVIYVVQTARTWRIATANPVTMIKTE